MPTEPVDPISYTEQINAQRDIYLQQLRLFNTSYEKYVKSPTTDNLTLFSTYIDNLKIIYHKDKPNLDFSFISDSSKAYQKFGWVAQTSLEVGLNRTIKWWKNTYQPKE